jgi:hypothetical protein
MIRIRGRPPFSADFSPKTWPTLPSCQANCWRQSMIRDTFASAKLGTIDLCLAPLLSLSNDQVMKLEIKAKTPHLVSIHLDEYSSSQHFAPITNSAHSHAPASHQCQTHSICTPTDSRKSIPWHVEIVTKNNMLSSILGCFVLMRFT